MLDIGDGVGVSISSWNTTLDSYESVAAVDPLFQPVRFHNLPWFSPYYWRSSSLVGRYVSLGILPGRFPPIILAYPEFYLRFIIPERNMLRFPGESLQRDRFELFNMQ